MQDVINLFNNFDRYKGKELTNYLKPSIKLNQYKKFYDNNELVGFVNWAYIHDLVEKRFNKQERLNLMNGTLAITYG